MKSWKLAVVLAVISLLLAFALAAAQEPVRAFDQLDTRLTPGDTVRVAGVQGREVRGRVLPLSSDASTLAYCKRDLFPMLPGTFAVSAYA